MNQEKLANALRKLGEASYELADALFDSPAPVSAGGPAAVTVPPSPAPASLPPSIDELPFDDALIPADFQAQPSLADVSTEFSDQGSEAVCPKHRKPYRDGTKGSKFCPSKSDDPAWSNSKGWCSINPKSAAVWLRAQAAA